MRTHKIQTLLATMVLVLMASFAMGAITPYIQDFEAMDPTNPTALADDDWVVYGNVFSPTGSWLYGYGAFPAPNDGTGFCELDEGQGGIDQGAVQLVAYSDYNNADHAGGNLIESNVFREMYIVPDDVGNTWRFEFNAKLGNIELQSTALAFIKTIDPNSGYAMTNFITADMTSIPEAWQGYVLEITIDSGLIGQFLQIGFSNTATLYEGSGIFYDNINFQLFDPSAAPDAVLTTAHMGQNYPNPFNPRTSIDFVLDIAGPVSLDVYDIAGRKVATLEQGVMAAGEHHANWNGMTDAGLPVATGRYSYVLKTSNGQIARSMVLLK